MKDGQRGQRGRAILFCNVRGRSGMILVTDLIRTGHGRWHYPLPSWKTGVRPEIKGFPPFIIAREFIQIIASPRQGSAQYIFLPEAEQQMMPTSKYASYPWLPKLFQHLRWTIPQTYFPRSKQTIINEIANRLLPIHETQSDSRWEYCK